MLAFMGPSRNFQIRLILGNFFQRSPKKNRPKADFFEGKLFSEKSGTKIWGEKGRRLTEGFSI